MGINGNISDGYVFYEENNGTVSFDKLSGNITGTWKDWSGESIKNIDTIVSQLNIINISSDVIMTADS